MIRWGMIGCGNVTEKKSAPSFNKIPGSKLIAVGNRTPEKAEAYAKRHGVPAWHRDPVDVIHDPAVSVVYVATPPGTHMQYALETIGMGKPVYIEKPMARTWDECEAINCAAEEEGVPVYVAYYRRSLDYFRKVKEVIDSKALGKILCVNLRQYFPARDVDFNREKPPWRVIPDESGGGYFHDMGCHALDILFYIFGDPLHVSGSKANVAGLYDPEDTVGATLVLPDNVLVTGNWSFVVSGDCAQDVVEVLGEKGKMQFSIFSFSPITLRQGKKETAIPATQPRHIQMPLIQSVVLELKGLGTCPSTGRTAAITNRVMDEILKEV